MANSTAEAFLKQGGEIGKLQSVEFRYLAVGEQQICAEVNPERTFQASSFLTPAECFDIFRVGMESPTFAKRLMTPTAEQSRWGSRMRPTERWVLCC